MKDVFRVLVHRNSDCLHLRLEGEFDEEAAREVISMIGNNGKGPLRVFIHTNGLTRILPVGQEMFHTHFIRRHDRPVNYIFTGYKAVEIAPRGCRVVA